MTTALMALLGGLGLFMLGMELMTEGLRLGAGRSLQTILRRGTKTRLRGLLSGTLITGIVQSSSAVTVAAIGFVNAGLMKFDRAITVVYGSNLGTSMTAWLVALVGFKVSMDSLTFPMIGIGVFLSIFFRKQRPGYLGQALTGFGLFFLGITALKNGFGDIAEQINMPYFSSTVINVALYFALGTLLTLLMQSSSAAITVIMTAAYNGIVPLEAAAAGVIGANIGTTSTAVLATLNATANARRLAGAHVIFNLVTACVALLLLPLMMHLVMMILRIDNGYGHIGTVLAMFHSIFNILGILIMWPLTTALTRLLKERFKSVEEDLARPRFLDATLLKNPGLALHACRLETFRTRNMLRKLSIEVIERTQNTNRLARELGAINQLLTTATRYDLSLQQAEVPDTWRDSLTAAIRATRYAHQAADVLDALGIDQVPQPEVVRNMPEVQHFEKNCIASLEALDGEDRSDRMQALRNDYEDVRLALTTLGQRYRIDPDQLIRLLDYYNDMHRLVKSLDKCSLQASKLPGHPAFKEATDQGDEVLSTS
jgi:phosphate:Na+ symporter